MSRLKNDYDFLAGIYQDGALRFNKYRFLVDLYTNSDVNEDQNIGFDRINYIIHEVIQRSVFICEDDVDTILRFTEADIPILTVPGPGPYDQVVQAVIVTKLNSILEDTLVITETEISSVRGGQVTYVWEEEDEDDSIHSVVNCDDEGKWWACPEPRFVSIDEEEELSEEAQDMIDSATWEELNMHWWEENALELDIEFVPDGDMDDDDEGDEGDEDSPSTVLKMSDFNKKT